MINKGNLAALGDFIAPTFMSHMAGGPDVKGPDGFRQREATYLTAFPDMHLTIEEMLSEGDKVAVRFTSHGTHKGAYLGVAPSGKEITWTGIVIYHIANGKFQEVWLMSDLGQQLHPAPPAGQSKP